jgi:hypothetical protein
MECQVITAILNGEQRLRDADYLRMQMEHDDGLLPAARKPWRRSLVALLGHRQETTATIAAPNITTQHA